MQTFQTPRGEAGIDQIIALQESIQSQVEQMFAQQAKKDSIEFGLAAKPRSDVADETVRINARIRECEALITFHAGRALELALHVLYARGANRILGREFEGMTPDEQKQLNKDRNTHDLHSVYRLILKDVKHGNIKVALEYRYQQTLHKGGVDINVDDDVISSLLIGDDVPFHEKVMTGITDGTEKTFDQSDVNRSSLPKIVDSDFTKMPLRSFEDFLKKADSVYYGLKNARWAHYTARDHQYGRQYVVVGTKFFARLVQQVVNLSGQAWLWNNKHLDRFIVRHTYNVKKRVAALIGQNFVEEVELSELRSIEEMREFFRSREDSSLTPESTLKLRHEKWMFKTS